MAVNQSSDSPSFAGINKVRSSWGWFLGLGILLLLFGAICIVGTTRATLGTVTALGWLLVLAGIVGLIHSFCVGTGDGFSLPLLSALFRGFTGCLLILDPASGAAALTLVLALFFVVAGLFRAIGAYSLKLPRWGWAVFSGVVSLVLGILLLAQMPVASMWFLGFALGLDMILDGAALVTFAIGIQHSHKPYEAEKTAA